MPQFIAEIDIMPHKELLDPQGKTIHLSLQHMQLSGVQDVRIGKHIRLAVEANDEQSASALVETACKKLLANLIMETFTFTLKKG